ncbi:murein transglycosylase domain-containing protein [Sulfurivermis fontis]|jgi:membrane-bound lytic murein transglycosylase C|uniref:murein transglycosylase domain-containing protein n=1 Tax=Sulfurivermis fontis TaxID=1972068 RepID=UPI000FD7A12F|nr:murein transglycosylase domain-containing protein [Sulfurivermis fontis]
MSTLRKSLVILCAITTLGACSTYDVVRIATSGDPREAASNLAKYKAASYKQNPVQLVRDLQAARRDYQKLVDFLSGKAGTQWGRKEAVTPSNKRYVKYTQNYMSRAIVQFDRGLITVETLDPIQPAQSLRNAIVTTLLTPDDPRAVDLYSDKSVALSGKPYLHGLVVDERGRVIDTPALAESYADHLLHTARQTRMVDTEQGSKKVHYVQITMVSDYENRQAQRYAASVDKYAKQFGVSKSLIYAVMKTESSFNPFAVSSAPAYGLMQLVPETGGRDAYTMVKGYDHTPSKDYLFDADHNIELGTAYLHILEQRYLGRIEHPLTREYCTIAAYNGGAGNVFNMFSPDRAKAPDVINALPPAEVYRRLRDEHPRDETRRYLVKVLEARREFVNI